MESVYVPPVIMPHPAQHTRYASQPGHLAHGQTYRFVIRVASGMDGVLPGPVHAAGARGLPVAGSGLAAVGAAAEADRSDEEVPARRQFLPLLAADDLGRQIAPSLCSLGHKAGLAMA
jgi:hypothetical protein